MKALGVKIEADRYEPGGKLSGQVGWSLDPAPRRIEVNLFWQTSGKGTEDLEVVDTFTLDRPAAQGLEPFEFTLPIMPYSFSGRLITLRWGVEAVADKTSHSAFFTLAPGGEEIRLGHAP